MSSQFKEGESVLVAGKEMRVVSLSGDKATCTWRNNRNDVREAEFNVRMLRKNSAGMTGGSNLLTDLLKKKEIGDKVTIVGNQMYLESIDGNMITCVWFNLNGDLIRYRHPKFLLGRGSSNWSNDSVEPKFGFLYELKQILK